jgi:predicted MFS family arabinose efflux permease
LVHFGLAVGGFAIGTTEFASLLRYFAHDFTSMSQRLATS